MISIIMPAYNEVKNISRTIDETITTLDDHGLEFEVIVVDDGSTDETYDKATSLINKYQTLRVVRYEKNMGKGYALKYGFKLARGDLILFLDADSDLPSSQVHTFFDSMVTNKADIVIGSRRHPMSEVHIPLTRRILSIGYSLLIKILFNLCVSDTQVGIKLFRREVLQQVFPKTLVKKYAFDVENLANAVKLGYRIVEVPVVLNYHYSSNIDLKAIWYMFVDTIAIFYRMRILHYYDDEGEDAQECDESRTRRKLSAGRRTKR